MTSFEFDLHPLGPEVATAQVLYPYGNAESVMRAWRDVAADMPESVTPHLALWGADPEIPAELHGMKIVFVDGVSTSPRTSPPSSWLRCASSVRPCSI
ncbi:hypothetical protein [Actinopolyspora mortivallis]|uniref:hypothetical protein n=1 Tax=Actinopolyspora mortivallis TaxID=33906 RepID=UPI0012ED8F01|nr:hypothetical protein [Actinopolyspora mortivallis]